jgi:hypothetical protein
MPYYTHQLVEFISTIGFVIAYKIDYDISVSVFKNENTGETLTICNNKSILNFRDLIALPLEIKVAFKKYLRNNRK